jgi:hypothetical protein
MTYSPSLWPVARAPQVISTPKQRVGARSSRDTVVQQRRRRRQGASGPINPMETRAREPIPSASVYACTHSRCRVSHHTPSTPMHTVARSSAAQFAMCLTDRHISPLGCRQHVLVGGRVDEPVRVFLEPEVRLSVVEPPEAPGLIKVGRPGRLGWS